MARSSRDFIFDLDPGEDVKWGHVQEAALLVHTLLSELGLEAWLKTSGGKGLHVVVPLAPRLDYEAVKAFSQAFVRHLAKTIPQRFSAKSGASNRIGKVYVDYLRNGMGQTTVAAFSARAQPGMEALPCDHFAHACPLALEAQAFQRVERIARLDHAAARGVDARNRHHRQRNEFRHRGKRDVEGLFADIVISTRVYRVRVR